VLCPAAVRRTGTAAEARSPARPQAVAVGDAERSGARLTAREAVIAKGRQAPPEGRPPVLPTARAALSAPTNHRARLPKGLHAVATAPRTADRPHRHAKGLLGWPPTGLRPGDLRRSQRRGALPQPAQAVPRPGHPLHETGCLLPRQRSAQVRLNEASHARSSVSDPQTPRAERQERRYVRRRTLWPVGSPSERTDRPLGQCAVKGIFSQVSTLGSAGLRVTLR
jgi:hypothetical protein